MKKNLPISPHLQIYKPQITSLLSITHRITGFGLNLALILLSLWIISFGLGSDVYANFVTIFDIPPSRPAREKSTLIGTNLFNTHNCIKFLKAIIVMIMV